MANTLKQSTQTKVRIGPAVSVSDGFTPVTTLALSTADEAELLKANGAATVDISGATFAAVTGADGWFDLTLTTSHTDTVGELVVAINDDSLILPIYVRFQVVEESIYDALYGASAAGFDANTWYVRTTGNDSNSGHLATDAKLTVGAAITAAASGDKIIIGPGTFAVAIDTGGKALTIEGAGWDKTIISSAAANAVTLDSGCTLRALKAISTVISGEGVRVDTNSTDVLLERVWAVGEIDGLNCGTGVSRLRLSDCRMESEWDGIAVHNVDGFIIERTTCLTNGVQATGQSRAVMASTGTGLVRDSTIIVADAVANSLDAVGVYAGDQVVVDNCTIVVDKSNASATGGAYGVQAATAGSLVAIKGGVIKTSNAGSGAVFDLNASTGTIVDLASAYSTAKLNGTVRVGSAHKTPAAADNSKLVFDDDFSVGYSTGDQLWNANLTKWLGVAPLALVAQRVLTDLRAVNGSTEPPPNISEFFSDIDFAAWYDNGNDVLHSNLVSISNSTLAVAMLKLAAEGMVSLTVDNTAHTPTTTEFEADDITEATATHYKDRVVLWTTGALKGQVAEITAYSLVGGRGHFTVTAMTEAPANNDTGILV